MFGLSQGQATLSSFYTDIQQFAFSNSILVTASGFSVGVATKEVIQNLLILIGLPALKWLGAKLNLSARMRVPAMLGEIGWQIAVFILTIIFTFILLEYFVNRGLLGMKTVVDAQKFDSYIRSKAEAENTTIIPVTDSAVKQVEVRKEVESQLVDDKKRENTVGVVGVKGVDGDDVNFMPFKM
jgi:hypothetical protein